MGFMDFFKGSRHITFGELLDFLDGNIDAEAPVTITCRDGEYVCSPEDGPVYRIYPHGSSTTIFIGIDENGDGKVLCGYDLIEAVEAQVERYGEDEPAQFNIMDEYHYGNSVSSNGKLDVEIDPDYDNGVKFTGDFATFDEL